MKSAAIRYWTEPAKYPLCTPPTKPVRRLSKSRIPKPEKTFYWLADNADVTTVTRPSPPITPPKKT